MNLSTPDTEVKPATVHDHAWRMDKTAHPAVSTHQLYRCDLCPATWTT